MGFLTTVTLYNDALHVFKENPKEFAEALFDGIDLANRHHVSKSVSFKNHANYIDVQPSRHADDNTVYIHSGNSVFNLNPWNKDFEELINRDPDIALNFIKKAELIIKEAKNRQKQKNLKKPLDSIRFF